jgi:hypothetical protein
LLLVTYKYYIKKSIKFIAKTFHVVNLYIQNFPPNLSCNDGVNKVHSVQRGLFKMASFNRNKTIVPFFVLRLDGDGGNAIVENAETDTCTVDMACSGTSLHRTKALFTVPKELANALTVHPVLCCGASFHLEIDDAFPVAQPPQMNLSKGKNTTKTTFISTSYDSVDPDSTAEDISQRIATRIVNIRNAVDEMKQHQQQQQQKSDRGVDANDEANMILATQDDWAKVLL